MKRILGFLFIISLLGVPVGVHASNPGEGKWVADSVYRGVNYSGMTGLIRMNSAYTVRDGELAVNTGALSWSFGGVDYTLIPANFTYGLTNAVEVGLSANYINTNIVSGTGDTELKFKWRFRNQSEYLPATSLMLGFILPTAATGISGVTSWGAKLHFLASSEAPLLDDSYIGMYIDVGTASMDPGSATSATYTESNIGLLFPISDDDRLQAIIEFNSLSGTIPLIGAVNSTGTTYGLRYASEAYKMSMGAETLTAAGVSVTQFILTVGVEF